MVAVLFTVAVLYKLDVLLTVAVLCMVIRCNPLKGCRGEFTKTNCSPKCIRFGEQQNRLKTSLNIRFGEPINTQISWFRENIRFGDTQIH